MHRNSPDIKVQAGHEAYCLFSACLSLVMRFSALQVLGREHSKFPFGNHRSQLCEGVMGTRHCQLGIRDAKVWSWTSGSLSAGAELMERQQDAQPLSHEKRRTDHRPPLQWVGLPEWQNNLFMWKFKPDESTAVCSSPLTNLVYAEFSHKATILCLMEKMPLTDCCVSSGSVCTY